MKKFIENELIKALSAIKLMGITVTIIAVFYFQFVMEKLPCPLCLTAIRAISNWIWFFT